MGDYDWDLGPKLEHCEQCNTFIRSFNHRPWCRAKITEEEWWLGIKEKEFNFVELNVLIFDHLYECKTCFSLVREVERHWKTHFPNLFQ